MFWLRQSNKTVFSHFYPQIIQNHSSFSFAPLSFHGRSSLSFFFLFLVWAWLQYGHTTEELKLTVTKRKTPLDIPQSVPILPAEAPRDEVSSALSWVFIFVKLKQTISKKPTCCVRTTDVENLLIKTNDFDYFSTNIECKDLLFFEKKVLFICTQWKIV